MAKKEEKKTLFFKAKMEMTHIGTKLVKFRVKESDGLDINDMHHIHVNREDFPRDENFSFDFMDRNIEIPKEPKNPGKDAMKVDVMEYEKAMAEIKALKKMKDKQDGFKALRNMEIIIQGV